jgi:hypothetical protein
MNLSLKEIDELFTSVCSEVEPFNNLARSIEFQKMSVDKLSVFLQELRGLKKQAVELKNEEEANRILYYENIIKTFTEELKMWIAFKNNDPQSAWDNLINAQSSLRAALLSIEVGDLLDHYVEKLDQLEKHLFPQLLFMSVGAKPIVKSCSICKQDYDDCEHIKGYPYLGELCHVVIEKSELEEVSIVEIPANKHCRILTTIQDGVERDYMTWNEIAMEQNVVRDNK